jgi:mevalonate kinase
MMATMPTVSITTRSPGKIILLGEHSVNRGQLALAVSVGLNTTCRLEEIEGSTTTLAGAGRAQSYDADELKRHTARLDQMLATRDFAGIRDLLGRDFFASSAYLVGQAAEFGLPPVRVTFESEIPMSCGLGSGGAVHAALALALVACLREHGRKYADELTQAGVWAYSGDRVAHGGIASALDTQTSLLGGAIEYMDGQPGRRFAIADGLRLVIGHTGVPKGSTGSVNDRIRTWLAEDASRIRVFEEMGRLAVAARTALQGGQWAELGRLMNRNQELLVQAGASHPQLDQLCIAARAAGALGAKLTGAGGGGVMIALVTPATEERVAGAISAAGGTPLSAPVAVPGASRLAV